jgi:NhaA family Na+:H+ antiporter
MDALETVGPSYPWRCPVGLGLERCLDPVTAYVIMPLFARFNRGVLRNYGVVKGARRSRRPGSNVRVLIGKRVGITAANWIVIRFRLAEIPSGVNWGQIHGSAIRAGVGFTMSLFVSDLPSGANNSSDFLKSASWPARLFAPRFVTTLCGRRESEKRRQASAPRPRSR